MSERMTWYLVSVRVTDATEGRDTSAFYGAADTPNVTEEMLTAAKRYAALDCGGTVDNAIPISVSLLGKMTSAEFFGMTDEVPMQ